MSESEQTANGAAAEGHNSNVLSEDQQRALAYHHLRHWREAKKREAEAKAEVKKAEKRAKADNIEKSDLKQLEDLTGISGDAALRTSIERSLRLARWAGAQVGQQFSFLDEPDRTPILEQAYERGKLEGMKGETARTPEGYAGETEQAYLRGWHDGQAILMSALDLTKANTVDQPKKRGRKPKTESTPAPSAADAPAAPEFAG